MRLRDRDRNPRGLSTKENVLKAGQVDALARVRLVQRPKKPGVLQPLELGAESMTLVAVTFAPLSLLVPFTWTHCPLLIAEAPTDRSVVSLVLELSLTVTLVTWGLVEALVVLVRMPERLVPLTVSVLPLTEMTEPDAKPKLPPAKPGNPDAPVGRLPAEEPPAPVERG